MSIAMVAGTVGSVAGAIVALVVLPRRPVAQEVAVEAAEQPVDVPVG